MQTLRCEWAGKPEKDLSARCRKILKLGREWKVYEQKLSKIVMLSKSVIRKSQSKVSTRIILFNILVTQWFISEWPQNLAHWTNPNTF